MKCLATKIDKLTDIQVETNMLLREINDKLNSRTAIDSPATPMRPIPATTADQLDILVRQDQTVSSY